METTHKKEEENIKSAFDEHLFAVERVFKKYEEALWGKKVAEHKLWLIESLLKNGRSLTTVDFHLIVTTVDKHEEGKNDTNK